MALRYSRWDGSQQLALDADDVLSELADDLLDHGDLRRALQRFMQRGSQDQSLRGLQDMMRRLQQRRQQTLNQYNMDSIIDEMQKRLEEILKTEREGIGRRLQEAQDRMQPPQDNAGSGEGEDQSGDPDQGQDGEQEGQGQRRRQQQSPAGQRGRPGTGQRGQQGQPQDGGEPSDDAFTPDMAEQMMKFLERMAQEKQEYLEQLPQDPAGQIQQLQNYEFMDPEAKRKFDELMEMLKQQVMNSMFQNMMQGMQDMTPEQMERLKDMLKQLNRMMKDKLQGKEPNFQEFKDQFGDMVPGDPQSLEEMMGQMQGQMQVMRSLLESMSEGQRQQLSDMMENLMQDMGLRQQVMEMSLALDQLFPMERPERYPFQGDDPVSLQEAMRLMDELRQLSDLEQQMKAAQRGDLAKVDTEKVRDLLGEDDANNLERLKQIEKMLEEAGYLKRDGNKLELTARALRKIGQKTLRDIFSQLRKSSFGNHSLDRRGAGRERADDTKTYEYGDAFLLNLEQTLMNALEREGTGTPIKLVPDDFEVHRTETLSQTSTVLMLDLSRSMGLTGRFTAAKKVALALSSLIKTQFPRDNLYVVGFADYARELKGEGLQLVNWSHWVSGTNMHHGFMLARKLLAQHKGGTRQIIMVTDGEPTAHLMPNGQSWFDYPPSPYTIKETLKEVQRCTREGITINTFMLERSYYLMQFIEQVGKINRGRVFYTSPDRLGEYVLVDFLSHKRRKVS